MQDRTPSTNVIPLRAAPPTITEGLPPLLAIPRAAALLGISRASAYRLAASGELPSRRLGGRIYLITHHLDSLLHTEEQDAA